MNYESVKVISEDFVQQTYGNDIPDGYCFSLCYPLSVLFLLMEIGHEFTFGKAMKGHMQLSHFWITLDEKGTILNPTIRQFNPAETKVYFGDILANETTKRYEKLEPDGDDLFYNTYASWADPLLQIPHRRQIPFDLEQRLISFNVAASHVLISHVIKMGLEEKLLTSQYGLYYFKPVSSILKYKYPIDRTRFGLHHASLQYMDKVMEIGSFPTHDNFSIISPML